MKDRKKGLINVAFIFALAILISIGWVSFKSAAGMIESDEQEDRMYATIQELDKLFSALQDVETGQRGYIITGNAAYLKPYSNALDDLSGRMATLKSLAGDNPQQLNVLNALKALIARKVSEVKEGIEIRRTEGPEAASRYVSTNEGQILMDEIRKRLTDDEARQMSFLRTRAERKASDATRSIETVVAGSGLSFLLLFAVFTALKKELASFRTSSTKPLKCPAP